MITDGEVGELWRSVNGNNRDAYSASLYDYMRQLIRKLVEERTRYKHSRCRAQHVHYMTDSHFEQTLRDFGISEDEWKIKK